MFDTDLPPSLFTIMINMIIMIANLGITTPPSLSSCRGSGVPLKIVSESDSFYFVILFISGSESHLCKAVPLWSSSSVNAADAVDQITFLLLRHFLTVTEPIWTREKNKVNLVGKKTPKIWPEVEGYVWSRAGAAGKLLKILQRIWSSGAGTTVQPESTCLIILQTLRFDLNGKLNNSTTRVNS